jgi:mpaB/rubber oxygenase-like protein
MTGANESSRWTDERLNRMRKLGDRRADKRVKALFKRGDVDAVNDLMDTLVSNDQLVPEGLPKEIQAYLAESWALPEWADLNKIKRGQQLFETWGVLITLCLFCASLPAAYAAANGVKVLYLTAQLDTNTRRRVMETGQFLMDVLAVGGLGDDGKGLRTIQRVRLMHAAVRQLIEIRNKQQPGLWDSDWGTPINQEDLAGTLLTFSYVVAEPMPRLGVRLPDEDVEAYIHTWNVIGHLLGLCDDMLVHDVSDATALVDAIRRRQFRASPEGQDMTAALLKLLDELTPFHQFDETIPPLIRHLIGEDVADLLLVPKSDCFDNLGRLDSVTKWVYVHVFGQSERDSPRYQVMSRLAYPFGRNLLHGVFRLERGGQRAPFNMPDHLARNWELST